jgi:hypothetical protein
MKIITILILILLCMKQLFAQNDEIEKTFTKFQTAILQQDCKKLVELSSFPIEGDIGLARLVTSDPPLKDMEKYNFEISKDLLMYNCNLMDSIELEVLKLCSFNTNSKNAEVEYEDCIYKSHLYIAEDKSYFLWSVGCVELLEESIGEYSMIFTFKLIDGEYKLKQIHGVG